jgi:hypothetical protein
MPPKKKVSVSLDSLRAEAAEMFVAEYDGAPLSPAATTTALAEKYDRSRGPLVGLVAEVYYAENGARFPLAFRAAKPKAATVAKAVRERRDAGGRLARWEVIAYSLAAGLGRPVSVSAVRELYVAAGGNLGSSYSGRGTRAGAKATREDATAELNLA